MATDVVVDDVSAWFGQKVALSELTVTFGAGVTGLLGPNGAGKTTLLRVITGLLPPSKGKVTVAGGDPRRDTTVRRTLALVPEDEAVPGPLTARQLVEYRADLNGVRDAPAATAAALEQVGLTDVADRRLEGFSKGMRQRAKVAAALVSDPRVLVLDEPLNGADPVQRVKLITLFRRLGDDGRTVIVSSHVLHEVERLAERIVVLVNGRLAAEGDRRAIHDAMVDRPRRVLVRASAPHDLGAALLAQEVVTGVTIEGDVLTVATQRAGDLALLLPRVAQDIGVRLTEVRPLDESLESIFRERAVTQLVLMRYALRACLPTKRRLGLLLPAAGAVLFGLLAHVIEGTSRLEAFGEVASSGLFGIVLPIGSLVIGDAVLGAEVRSGTMHFTWLSPVPRWSIIVGRWLAGTIVAGFALSASCALAAVVAGVPDAAPAMAAAALAGTAAYVAVFVLVGAAARRAVVWSLAVVVLIERLLGTALDGIAQLSPGWLARAAYGGLSGSDELQRNGVPFGWAAVWRLAVVTAVALAIASWRLKSLRAAGHGE